MGKVAKLNKPMVNRIVGHGEERVDQMLANPLNFRLHPANQQEALAGSIDDIGFIRSVTVNQRSGRVIDGHLRVTIAARSEVETLPVEYVDMDEAEEAQALLSLDPIAAMAATDKVKLDELMRAVQSDDQRVQTMLSEMAEKEGLEYGKKAPAEDPGPQVDKAEELREKWQVSSGQLWACGDHRIICGDCTDKAVVERLMGEEKAEMLLTDPPYGVKYDSSWRAPYSSGEYAVGEIANDDRADWTEVYQLIDAPVAYVWHGGLHADVVAGNLKSVGYELRAQIIWNKGVMVFGRGHYHWKHEPCWYAVKKGSQADWGGDRTQNTVWDCANNSGASRTGDDADDFNAGHISQKPVSLMERAIKNHKAMIVADPFLGSGTTLIACERLGRKCRAVEISPAYVAVALQRWSDMTNQQPSLIP
jgi:DNA modification methylase